MFLEEKEGSALRSWIRYFDPDMDLRVTNYEFGKALQAMGYQGDAKKTFQALDDDGSGEVTLVEIDIDQAHLWRRFRLWCAETFENSEDMLHRIGGKQAKRTGHLSQSQFKDGLNNLGWEGGEEDLLFSAFEENRQKVLEIKNFAWLDVERRRQQRRLQYKMKSMRTSLKHANDVVHAKAALKKFKEYLKRIHGTYVKAWRVALSPGDAMVLQKTQFFKACSLLGFGADAKLIWHAFGKSDSGSLSLDELDPKGAEILAQLQAFAQKQFGGSAACFKAFDKQNLKKLGQPEFVAALKEHGCGFQKYAKHLFHYLNREGGKEIREEDMRFLDKWKPPEFLLVPPNPQAMEKVKSILLDEFGHYLKAWRRLLDLDSSNRCTWSEFKEACKKIGFSQDAAGAWRALDEDLSGFITLREIDKTSSESLADFKRWADGEFGSVKTSYYVFDHDNSHSVSSREFRRCCSIYGYEGNAHLLFRVLDVEGNGSLGISEISFLDEWALTADPEEEEEETPAPWTRKSSTSTQGTPRSGPLATPRGSAAASTPRAFPSASTPKASEATPRGNQQPSLGFSATDSGSVQDNERPSTVPDRPPGLPVAPGAEGAGGGTKRSGSMGPTRFDDDPPEATREATVERRASFEDEEEVMRPHTSPVVVRTGTGTTGGTGSRPLSQRSPRVVPMPERFYWSDKPLSGLPPAPSRREVSSRGGRRMKRWGQATMWCSLCRSRGPCRHMSPPRTISTAPAGGAGGGGCSGWRPGYSSMFPPAPAAVSADNAGLAGLRRQLHKNKPLLPDHPPRGLPDIPATRRLADHAADDLGVQVEALSRFPIGSFSARAPEVVSAR